MSAVWRYSVCRPGLVPVEVFRVSDRATALRLADEERAAGRPAETWDWMTNQTIDEVTA